MNTDKILAEAIAKDYIPEDNSKIKALKRLDAQAKLPATIFTHTLGIISALVAGTGMCLSMQVIGGGVFMMVLGIVIGILGFIGCDKTIEQVSHIIREAIFGLNGEIKL